MAYFFFLYSCLLLCEAIIRVFVNAFSILCLDDLYDTCIDVYEDINEYTYDIPASFIYTVYCFANFAFYYLLLPSLSFIHSSFLFSLYCLYTLILFICLNIFEFMNYLITLTYSYAFLNFIAYFKCVISSCFSFFYIPSASCYCFSFLVNLLSNFIRGLKYYINALTFSLITNYSSAMNAIDGNIYELCMHIYYFLFSAMKTYIESPLYNIIVYEYKTLIELYSSLYESVHFFFCMYVSKPVCNLLNINICSSTYQFCYRYVFVSWIYIVNYFFFFFEYFLFFLNCKHFSYFLRSNIVRHLLFFSFVVILCIFFKKYFSVLFKLVKKKKIQNVSMHSRSFQGKEEGNFYWLDDEKVRYKKNRNLNYSEQNDEKGEKEEEEEEIDIWKQVNECYTERYTKGKEEYYMLGKKKTKEELEKLRKYLLYDYHAFSYFETRVKNSESLHNFVFEKNEWKKNND